VPDTARLRLVALEAPGFAERLRVVVVVRLRVVAIVCDSLVN
jgi:hypothetical protein